MAQGETLTTLPAASSITLPVSATLESQVVSVTNFANHMLFLQDTAPTTSINKAFVAAYVDAATTEDYLTSLTTSNLTGAQSDEADAITSWQSTATAWNRVAAITKRYCEAVGKTIAYITKDWVSSCMLPKFILHVRWSTGKTLVSWYKESLPGGPWIVHALFGGPGTGDSLPLWVQADWEPGKPDVGITSVPGTVGGCNEVSPGTLPTDS